MYNIDSVALRHVYIAIRHGRVILDSSIPFRSSIVIDNDSNGKEKCGFPIIDYSTPCLKKTPPLTCYNLGIHGSMMIIFGTSVTEKVGNQNVLYFPTSPNLCFCTTWGNRKPKNCVFSLKCCTLFTKNTWNILKYRLVTAEPTFTVKTIDWMHQTGPRILLSVTHMLCVNLICHGVGRCVKAESCSLSSLSESQWTVLMGNFTISTNVDAIKHIIDNNFFRKTAQ